MTFKNMYDENTTEQDSKANYSTNSCQQNIIKELIT